MVAATYAVLAIALLLVLPISIAALPDTHLWSSSAFFVALASAFVIAALMRRELRRDLPQLCVFWLLVGLLLTLLSLASVHEHPWIGGAGIVFFASTWIASVVILARGALAKDEVPSPILQRFDPKQVFEVAGVQLALECANAEEAVRGAVDLQLFLQNCWDRERTVIPKLTSRGGLFGVPGGARFEDEQSTLTLAPGEFGVWTLPACVTTARQVFIFVDVAVSGLDGRRLYRRRVQALPARVPRLITLLVALASFGTAWVWGGGLRLTLPAGERAAVPTGRARNWRSFEVWE